MTTMTESRASQAVALAVEKCAKVCEGYEHPETDDAAAAIRAIPTAAITDEVQVMREDAERYIELIKQLPNTIIEDITNQGFIDCPFDVIKSAVDAAIDSARAAKEEA